MKRYILSIALVTSCLFASAQGGLGYEIGLNLGHSLLDQTTVLPGHRIGVHFPIPVSKYNKIDIGLRVDNYGYVDKNTFDEVYKIEHDFTAVGASIVYHTFLGKKNLKDRPYLGFGVKLGYIIQGETKIYEDSADFTTPDVLIDYNFEDGSLAFLNNVRFGPVIEGGLSFQLGKTGLLMMGLTYEFELIDIFNEVELEIPDSDNSPLGIITINTRMVLPFR